MKFIQFDGTHGKPIFINADKVACVREGELPNWTEIDVGGVSVVVRHTLHDVLDLLAPGTAQAEKHSIEGIVAGIVEGQRCDSAGCVRKRGHTGFCATSPEIAKKHDQA